LKVVDSDGNVLIDNTKPDAQKVEQVMSIENADMIRSMMQGVINQGTGGSVKWRYQVTEDLAGKTGTSQDCSDGWFIASIEVNCWSMGRGEFPEIHLNGNFTGAFTALPIVGKFLHSVEKDKALLDYTREVPPISEEARMKLNCAFTNYVDSTQLDSIALDSLAVDDDVEGIHTNRGDESSVKDTTKSKKFFDKLFDRKKEDR
jgi:penicillin-binding protein 1A